MCSIGLVASGRIFSSNYSRFPDVNWRGADAKKSVMSEKLPPGTRCVVCDDIATGNHYSVPSCNGCKTFFRRALVNNRQFQCSGNGNCPVNKGVRCACRYCRLQKCLQVGMDKNAIQSDRDRIGYTKRTRKADKTRSPSIEHMEDDSETRHSGGESCDVKDFKIETNPLSMDPYLERLTTLENNLTMLLSRGHIEPYATLDDALNAPSRFNSPINARLQDPIACPHPGSNQQPFWRSRIIALYIDWAKTFSCFRKLPHADKVALITNHASSYLIMCEVFRTPEHIDEIIQGKLENCLNNVSSQRPPTGGASSLLTVVLNNDVARSFANTLELKTKVKREPTEAMIRLPTEYGSLPADYGRWIPEDYGTPVAGTEGRSDMHQLFDSSFGRGGVVSSEHGNDPIRDVACELTPVMAAMIDFMMKPFRQLNVSTTEFAVLQAVMFFDPDTEGLDAASQRNVEAEQQRLLTALHRHLLKSYSTDVANDRYSNILLRIPTIRKVAAKKNESLQMIDMLNLFSLNSLVKETALGPRASRTNTLADGYQYSATM